MERDKETQNSADLDQEHPVAEGEVGSFADGRQTGRVFVDRGRHERELWQDLRDGRAFEIWWRAQTTDEVREYLDGFDREGILDWVQITLTRNGWAWDLEQIGGVDMILRWSDILRARSEGQQRTGADAREHGADLEPDIPY